MLTKTALAAWGSGALVVSAAGLLVVTQLTAGAAPASTSPTGGSTQAAGSAAKAKPTPTATPTQGAGSGNSGNGVGNGAGGAQPPPKALIVSVYKATSSSPHVDKTIAPGVEGKLRVKVENPNNQAVNLTGIVSTITGVTKDIDADGDCLAGWFDIADWSPTAGVERINKNTFKIYDLAVTFLNKPLINQDGCKGASYSFTFTATANQA